MGWTPLPTASQCANFLFNPKIIGLSKDTLDETVELFGAVVGQEMAFSDEGSETLPEFGEERAGGAGLRRAYAEFDDCCCHKSRVVRLVVSPGNSSYGTDNHVPRIRHCTGVTVKNRPGHFVEKKALVNVFMEEMFTAKVRRPRCSGCKPHETQSTGDACPGVPILLRQKKEWYCVAEDTKRLGKVMVDTLQPIPDDGLEALSLRGGVCAVGIKRLRCHQVSKHEGHTGLLVPAPDHARTVVSRRQCDFGRLEGADGAREGNAARTVVGGCELPDGIQVAFNPTRRYAGDAFLENSQCRTMGRGLRRLWVDMV